jgi:hypothetical protein
VGLIADMGTFLEGLVPFHWLILEAFIDPVVIGIGLWMGWNANQFGKLILAGLAAGLAGTAVTFILRMLDISWFEGGYIFGGAHALFRVIAGYAWSVVGFVALRIRDQYWRKSDPPAA